MSAVELIACGVIRKRGDLIHYGSRYRRDGAACTVTGACRGPHLGTVVDPGRKERSR